MNHRVSLFHQIIEVHQKGPTKRYKILGFVEMDHTATFSILQDTLAGASFVFNDDANEDLGLPKVFGNCDVL